MSSITNRTTAQSPSRFGMPIHGSAFAATCVPATALGTVVRDRCVAGDPTSVKGAFPGAPAWSPPTC